MQLPFKVGLSPTLKIRGLIAIQNIKKGILIEKCPLILVDVKQEEFLERSNLRHYYFTYSGKFHAIVLGYLSLVNHSQNPNCKLVWDYKNKRISLKSIKDIKKNEELTYEYMDKIEAKKYPELFNFNKSLTQ